MSLRRGLFRIWLVASVCWIGFVILMRAPAIVDDFKFHNDLVEARLLPAFCDDARGRFTDVTKKNGWCWVDLVRFRALYPDEANKEVQELREIYSVKNDITNDHWLELGWAALLAVIPSMLLFFVGMILLWIARGFRRDTVS